MHITRCSVPPEGTLYTVITILTEYIHLQCTNMSHVLYSDMIITSIFPVQKP